MANGLSGFLSGISNGIATSLTPQNNFNANTPLDVGALNNQIAQSQGNFQQNYQNQNALASALLAQANGQGPSPAQAAYNENLANAIKQNASMIKSQKGINPGLGARLAAQNSADMSQQAAGQSAVMNAEQQLNAQNALSNLYGTMGAQNLQNISTSGQLANQSSLGAQQINAGVSAQNAAANQNTFGGLLNGVGGAISSFLNKGGVVKHMDDGGFTDFGDISSPFDAPAASVDNQQNKQNTQLIPTNTASDQIANNILRAGGVQLYPAGNASLKSGQGAQNGISQFLPYLASAMSKGGKVVPVHLHHVASIYHPDFNKNAELKSKGGKVPGQAKVKGNSPKNDTVPTMLSPGELVIPRSVMSSDDPVKAGADFIAQKLKESGKYKKIGKDDFHDALKKAISTRKVSNAS